MMSYQTLRDQLYMNAHAICMMHTEKNKKAIPYLRGNECLDMLSKFETAYYTQQSNFKFYGHNYGKDEYYLSIK